MIHAELIYTITLSDAFHKYAEQLTGVNTASVVQSGKRPKSKHAYTLAYWRAFNDPACNTADVKALLGMLHFGMLCAGAEMDMAEVTGWPHGLRCLQSQPSRRGVIGVVFTGDGEQWATAIRNASAANVPVQEWGMACYRQFAKYDLADLMGKARPVGGGTQYLLEG